MCAVNLLAVTCITAIALAVSNYQHNSESFIRCVLSGSGALPIMSKIQLKMNDSMYTLDEVSILSFA